MKAIDYVTLGRRLQMAHETACQPVCRKYDLNTTMLTVLLFCALHPEQNTARDLCEMRGMKSSIVSVAVEQLIRRGLMRREADTGDRRVHRLVPTPGADEVIQAGLRAQQAFQTRLRAGISQEETAVFERVMQKLQTNIDREPEQEENHALV